MPRTRGIRRGWLSSILGLLALCLSPATSLADADDIVAIVNEKNPSAEISIHDLRLLYGLYRRAWQGGTSVVLVVPEAGTPAMAFLTSRVFRRQNESDIERHFVQAVFQGRIAQAPAQLSTELAISLVRGQLGAIALVPADQVSATSGVRVLRISEISAATTSGRSEG